MGALIAVLAAPALVLAPVKRADPVARWMPLVAEAARRFALPQAWIVRVIRAESGGRTELHGRPIRSSRGAMGLMQLMRGTWATMRAVHALGPDPDDPHDNIMAGAAYLRAMYDRFGYPGLFGAYNAGPTGYAAWRAGRRRLPTETIVYLAKVAGPEVAFPTGDGWGASRPLFILRAPPDTAPVAAPQASGSDMMFALRKVPLVQ
jgi:soluble lytic murein transglycosylase-like protein